MVSRYAGAGTRAIFAAILFSTPSLLLPGVAGDVSGMALLLGLAAGLFVYCEYAGTSPGLINFRSAPPFNRIRFISFFLTLFILSVAARGTSDTTASALVMALSELAGHIFRFEYSPVWWLERTFGASGAPLAMLGGIGYLISLLTILVFAIVIRATGWPMTKDGFNTWVNLPTFDPTTCNNVARRLRRIARINLILGLTLPFMGPMIVWLMIGPRGTAGDISTLTLVWGAALWAYVPTSLVMKGLAMRRLSRMVAAQRRADRVRIASGFATV